MGEWKSVAEWGHWGDWAVDSRRGVQADFNKCKSNILDWWRNNS
jgi:hypothetical protein